MTDVVARLIHWYRTPIDTCVRKGSGIDKRVTYHESGEVVQQTAVANGIDHVTCIVCRMYYKLHNDIAKAGKGVKRGDGSAEA